MDPQTHLRAMIANALGTETLTRLELETQLTFANAKIEELKRALEEKDTQDA